jgi:hypothetical protein
MTTPNPRRLLLLLGAMSAFGSCICVERPKRMTDDERARLAAHILTEVPATMQTHVGADLDGRIELVGYDLRAERDPQGRFVAGRPITITWYWKCNEPLEDGWRLFTHVVDDAGVNRIPADDRGDVRQHYPPSAWRAGEIIQDEQEIPIPADFNSRTLTLFVGAWFGPHRLPVRNDAPSDGTGRIRLGPFPFQYELPSVDIPRISATLEPDGRLDEPEWGAAVAVPFVRAPDGPAAGDRIRARLLWSPRFLYVAFEVRDQLLVSQFAERDDPIYNQDVVEVFLDEDGDGKNYYEFQVSPAGVQFDQLLTQPRTGDPKAFDARDFRAGVALDGTLNDDTPDRGYVVELQIPFASLAGFSTQQPQPGTVWRGNLFVLDATRLPDQPRQTAPQEGFAWSAPKKNDFHEFRRFGEFRFGGSARIPPRVAPPPPPIPQPPAEGARAIEMVRPTLVPVPATE